MSEPGAGGQAEAGRADTGRETGARAAGAAGEPEAHQAGEPLEVAGTMPSPAAVTLGSGGDAGAAGEAEAAAGPAHDTAESPARAEEPPAGAAVPPANAEEPPGKGLRGRAVSLRVRLPRTRRGIFALLLVVGAFAFAGIWTSVTLVHWTETADFCGRCHQMGPELAGYEAGAHQDVTCGECHVEPGVAGWIKAKLNGTRQLIQVLTGTYPKPIPPPDHSDLPAVQDTCLKLPLARPAGDVHARTRARRSPRTSPTRAVRRPHDPAQRRRPARRHPERPLARPAGRPVPLTDREHRRRSTRRGEAGQRNGRRVHRPGPRSRSPRTSSPTSTRSRPPRPDRTDGLPPVPQPGRPPDPEPAHGPGHRPHRRPDRPHAALRQARGDADPLGQLPERRGRRHARPTSWRASTR